MFFKWTSRGFLDIAIKIYFSYANLTQFDQVFLVSRFSLVLTSHFVIDRGITLTIYDKLIIAL